MMGHRAVCKGYEGEAFSNWRRVTHWKPGRLKKIKRRYNKRMRREAKRYVQDQAVQATSPFGTLQTFTKPRLWALTG